MRVIDLAYEAGRQLQSEQTGLIHYCYQSKDPSCRDTIPTLENALFALTLFRTRTVENVLEGKAILEKLLAFEVEGNFPIYLHEYPQASNPYLRLRLAPILFWILHDFSHVIGELKGQLETLLKRLLEVVEPQNLPAWAKFRIDAFEGKVGKAPQTLHDWAESLVSLQIAEKRGAKIDPLLEEALSFWHPTLSLYVGPCLRRQSEGAGPELTLFDLYLSEWHKRFPQRALEPRPVHLRGALIRPLGKEILAAEKPIPYVHFAPEEDLPYIASWEGHSLALAKRKLTSVERQGDEFILSYPEELPESEEKSLEVSFYLNYDLADEIWVNGKKANTFRSGDLVEIVTRGARVQLSFSSEEGRYFGHIMRGNRPSQLKSTEFDAYDWRIAIRTVERSKETSIRVKLLLQAQESPQPLPLHASHCPHTESSQ